MKALKSAVLVIASLCALVSTASPGLPADKGLAPARSASFDKAKFIDPNYILMFVTNYGGFGRDLAGVFGYDYGTFYPYSSIWDIESGINIKSPMYAAGLWLGGKVGGQVRVAVAEYGSEYTPGPMADSSFQPDIYPYRIYKLYSDSLASNPNDDYGDWPVSQGAPVTCHGLPPMRGDQMLWAVFNDANPALHTNGSGSTAPLGVEVRQTFWAYDRYDPNSALRSTVFIQYKLYNRGPNSISDFHIGLWADPDLGGYGDDLVGCDSTQDLFFCYNADNDDSYYGSQPPACGFRLIYGPVVPSSGDTAYFDGFPIAEHRNLDMTAFVKLFSGNDPANAVETYNCLQGLTADGSLYNWGGNDLTYMHSGDPGTGTGDLDFSPGDRRMLAACGPLTFNPGDSQYVLFKFGVGSGGDRLSSITALKSILAGTAGVVTDVNDESAAELPGTLSLSQNYPNPFNPSTTIEYGLPGRSHVTISIFNILGRRVRQLIDESKPAGTHRVLWNGNDGAGAPVSSGVYFFRVIAGNKTIARKMIMLK